MIPIVKGNEDISFYQKTEVKSRVEHKVIPKELIIEIQKLESDDLNRLYYLLKENKTGVTGEVSLLSELENLGIVQTYMSVGSQRTGSGCKTQAY